MKGRLVLIALAIIGLIGYFLFVPVTVPRSSMAPTIGRNHSVLANRLDYHFHGVERFDLIAFYDEYGDYHVKRVVGLAGEHIKFQRDQLYVDGRKYHEPFLTARREQIGGTLTQSFDIKNLLATLSPQVPDGYYFVLGDNRLHSLDSRSKGFISSEQVIGTVNLLFWPLDEFRWLHFE